MRILGTKTGAPCTLEGHRLHMEKIRRGNSCGCTQFLGYKNFHYCSTLSFTCRKGVSTKVEMTLIATELECQSRAWYATIWIFSLQMQLMIARKFQGVGLTNETLLRTSLADQKFVIEACATRKHGLLHCKKMTRSHTVIKISCRAIKCSCHQIEEQTFLLSV